jgi:serine phosphatase RsbU (regulator of sigma subunit)
MNAKSGLRTFILASLIFSLCLPYTAHSQVATSDSLKLVLLGMPDDTLRVNTLNQIASMEARADPNSAIKYGSEALELAQGLDFKRGMALAYKNVGLGYYFQSEYTVAYSNWYASLELYEELNDEPMIANLLGNLGAIYYATGDNYNAIAYNIRALKIAEKRGDSLRLATMLLNIGSVYSEQASSLDTARSYYLRALKLGEEIGYVDLLGLGSINLGEVYYKMGEYDSALFHFEKSLMLVSSQSEIATALSSIGRIYAERGEYQTAIKYHRDGLDIARKENAQMETVKILLSLAGAYASQGNARLAINYFEEARSMSETIGLNYELSTAYKGLATSYAEIADWKNAYYFLSLQDTVNNAIYRIETEDKTKGLMFSYQLDKKEDEIEILEQQSEIDQLKSKRQRGILIGIGVVGFMILLMAIGLYNRMRFIRETNRKINAQKDEIEAQKDEIESQRDKIQQQHDTVFHQKEMITDSISYAQRIQSALLPSQNLLGELVPEHFIVFKPKDIVSGDYYWVKEVQDHVVIVAADCTGHGVPGAFMSMLGITLLNDLIGDRCFNAPSAILEQLRSKIKTMLDQDGDSEEQKDGMDLALAIYNKNNRELHFAGANNPVYIIRNKEVPVDKELEAHLSIDNEEFQLFEIKGDKQPIGVHWEETPFKSHSVMLQEHDTFYMFSDGFVDQYGGEKRKKFKSLPFKRLLLSLQHESMSKQGKTLEQTFENWKGDLEQIDDVSVIGVKI